MGNGILHAFLRNIQVVPPRRKKDSTPDFALGARRRRPNGHPAEVSQPANSTRIPAQPQGVQSFLTIDLGTSAEKPQKPPVPIKPADTNHTLDNT